MESVCYESRRLALEAAVRLHEKANSNYADQVIADARAYERYLRGESSEKVRQIQLPPPCDT